MTPSDDKALLADYGLVAQMLRMHGVSDERMRGRVSTGLSVLQTRMDKEVATLRTALQAAEKTISDFIEVGDQLRQERDAAEREVKELREDFERTNRIALESIAQVNATGLENASLRMQLHELRERAEAAEAVPCDLKLPIRLRELAARAKDNPIMGAAPHAALTGAADVIEAAYREVLRLRILPRAPDGACLPDDVSEIMKRYQILADAGDVRSWMCDELYGALVKLTTSLPPA